MGVPQSHTPVGLPLQFPYVDVKNVPQLDEGCKDMVSAPLPLSTAPFSLFAPLIPLSLPPTCKHAFGFS